MESVPSEIIHAAVEILGARPSIDDSDEAQIRSLVTDDLTMRRLVDIIPEAFGLVLISHLSQASDMSFPNVFFALEATGEWHAFPMDCEPIFAEAIKIAQHVFHDGPRHIFKNNADRSGLLATVNDALNKGSLLDGSTLQGPMFFGIPASLYEQRGPGSNGP